MKWMSSTVMDMGMRSILKEMRFSNGKIKHAEVEICYR